MRAQCLSSRCLWTEEPLWKCLGSLRGRISTAGQSWLSTQWWSLHTYLHHGSQTRLHIRINGGALKRCGYEALPQEVLIQQAWHEVRATVLCKNSLGDSYVQPWLGTTCPYRSLGGFSQRRMTSFPGGSGLLPVLVTTLSPCFVISLNPSTVGIVTSRLRCSSSARPAVVTYGPSVVKSLDWGLKFLGLKLLRFCHLAPTGP